MLDKQNSQFVKAGQARCIKNCIELLYLNGYCSPLLVSNVFYHCHIQTCLKNEDIKKYPSNIRIISIEA